jgi:hypothetical protein
MTYVMHLHKITVLPISFFPWFSPCLPYLYPLLFIYILGFFFFFLPYIVVVLRQGLTTLRRLALTFICIPGWLWIYNPPASAFWVLGYRHVPSCLVSMFLTGHIGHWVWEYLFRNILFSVFFLSSFYCFIITGNNREIRNFCFSYLEFYILNN